MKYIFLVALFIQTHNGQVSIQKDLDEKTCKHILNTLSCSSNCFCSGLDENDELKYNFSNSSCVRMTQDTDIVKGECIK